MIGGQQKSKTGVDLDIGQGLIDSLGFVVAFGAPCRARLFLVRLDCDLREFTFREREWKCYDPLQFVH